MDSDDYFEDELDSAFLNEVNAIEAAHLSLSKPVYTSNAKPIKRQSSPRSVIELTDSDAFDVFDVDEEDLQRFDKVCQNEYQHQSASALRPAAGPSNVNLHRTTSKGKPSMERTHSSSRTLSGGRARKTKQWDHTAFAKSGWKLPISAKKKGKEKAHSFFDSDQDESDGEEQVEFEQFPAPFVPVGPPLPMKLMPDLLAAKRWIYPLNQPKRDYQFNIVKHCLFENTLVALPTGLGKTFIAGVVMLNFYNWFPKGKVIFLAPTKPLVAQQIDACHKTCGIPGSQAAELTGEISGVRRIQAWAEKRVFYMTPQTLMSGFLSETCDPRDIVLVVIDEAHRGSGDYSYAQIIRYMMAKNPYFRVLGLTATPGSDPEAVQTIVDCLHISHIEIRDEQSMDLRPYLHKKVLQQHFLPMSREIVKIRDLLSKIMQPLIKDVQKCGAMYGSAEPTMLHSFRCQQAMPQLRARKAHWAMPAAAKLSILARAMGYLLEASVGMCYTVLNSCNNEMSGRQAASKAQNSLQKDTNFKALMNEMETQKTRGFALHPKMEKLRVLLVQHFAKDMLDREEALGDGGQVADAAGHSRAMVFVSFRECVDEVVEMLNQESPLIRAVRFIGQGTDKQGRKGIAQREQLEVIKKFKAGEFNVLVSTSIGEEGLDIGEVDMIVCYDAQKTPVRMLQRIGRTGRKRDGIVHVLLAEGREERNWEKAQDKYREVQHFIVRAEQLELYGDAERLLPDHIKPECVEMVMEIEEHIRVDRGSRKGSLFDGEHSPVPQSKKRKRDDNPARNIPAGASTGFVNVRDLLVKGGALKKKRKTQKDFDVLAGDDDEDDLEIEAGLFGPRRAASTSVMSGSSKAQKIKRATTIASAGGTKWAAKPKKKKKQLKEPTGRQFELMGVEDSDDVEIERGLHFADSPIPRTPSPLPQRSPVVPTSNEVVDLTTPDPQHAASSPLSALSYSPDQSLKSRSASTLSRDKLTGRSSNPPEQSPSISSRSFSADKNIGDADMAWLIEDDEEPDFQVVVSSPSHRESSPRAECHVENVEDVFASPSAISNSARAPALSEAHHGALRHARNDMPLPAYLARSTSPILGEAFPEPSFAVRAPGNQARKRLISEPLDSSPLAMPPPSQRRLQRQRDSPSPRAAHQSAKRRKRKFTDVAEAQKMNPWIDVEATHSGDEHSLGSSDSDQPVDEYDRQFVQELPETQVSPSYDQSAVYRRSLFTQAPAAPGRAPIFAKPPVRRGLGVLGVGGISRSRTVISSSPRGDDMDNYEFGSFVVADDAEISLSGNSSSEL
ncbi:hypothetical protein AcW1_000425 [Taiwanofungus camphoratus]|nr:hypothetical protein AcW2_001078 [Antrodia cinnamomea]KAI0961311.1 hypothetical protein AcV7_000445 [Antrodia cinnamomea]KAI0963318.1 hypothetical protein AcW1_000425 [Antrodia cinnamomea]